MRTNYCDRCSTECQEGHELKRSVEIDWPDSPSEKESVVLKFSVCRPGRDYETPDLCDDCYAHILHEVASMLDSDRETSSPALAAVRLSVGAVTDGQRA